MKALIKRLNVTVPVCEYKPDTYVVWYDGQISREDPPSRLSEIEPMKDVEIVKGNTSEDYECELKEKCQVEGNFGCLKSTR